MTTKVDQSILVNVPVSTAYNQWTQFEDFPQFMSGVKKVTQLSDDRLQWVAEVAGVRRQWEARILEQVPDRKVAWAATSGATNAGMVSFEDLGGGQTRLHLSLEYEPEGLVEQVGDRLDVVERQAKGDLERFKEFIESEGYATGAWRGSINEGAEGRAPTAADAAASQSDSGKAGISGKAVAAGAAVAAAGVAAAASMKKKTAGETDAESVQTGDIARPVAAQEPIVVVDEPVVVEERVLDEPPVAEGLIVAGPDGPLIDPLPRRRRRGAAPSEAASRGEPARTRHRTPVPCGSDKACLFRNDLAEAGQ